MPVLLPGLTGEKAKAGAGRRSILGMGKLLVQTAAPFLGPKVAVQDKVNFDGTVLKGGRVNTPPPPAS